MLLFSIFSKMKSAIRERVIYHESGLYLYIVFPIAVIFLITFITARVVSNLWPDIYIPWAGVHVHHFAYGFFILAIAGYLALVFSGPRAKYWISMLHGIGLGLAFDEFGIWLHLRDDDPARWSYDGFLIVVGSALVLISAKPGIGFVKHHLPFRKKTNFPTPNNNGTAT